MTMTDRKDALTELLAKVEAGGGIKYEYHISTFLSYANSSHNAYNGSLDAAKALHEAIPTNAIMDEETAKIILFGRDGARTWLTWNLRALIADENTNANDKGE